MSGHKRGEEDLKALLKERAEIDELLQGKFSREMTIMFTDIKGSATFFESRGDIDGLSMVFQHNELLFPTVECHQGKVVKTIGDSIMASFPDVVEGVRAAIEMQRKLSTYNSTQPEHNHIQIRIGLNAGRGIVEHQDVFGEFVNLAARIESLADAGQILISQRVYEAVRQTDDIICRYFDCTKVKGKKEPIEVYRVVWGEEELIPGPKRSAARAGEQHVKGRKVFYLDISREDNKLKFITFEKAGMGERTIRPFQEKSISLSKTEEQRKEIVNLLNRANNRGNVAKEILADLRIVGHTLYEEIVPSSVREELNLTTVQDLIISIDGGLVHIPWELLYDGSQFFCQRFNMGRIVKTRQNITPPSERRLGSPLKMVIICDPRGDLKDSHSEGIAIRNATNKSVARINATLKSGGVKSAYLQEHIKYFDIVHYAGHADYDCVNPSLSGWLLEDGKFTSEDITGMMEMQPFPSLVFSNACHSGRTEEWSITDGYGQRIFSLANAFLLAGVQHYVGTFWEILDEPGARFALHFYRFMIEGLPVGECVRRARLELIKEYGEDTIVWASYMLYGDPSHTYLPQEKGEEDREAEKETVSDMQRSALKDIRHESVDLKRRKQFRKKVLFPGIGAFLLIALILGMIVLKGTPVMKDIKNNPYQFAYRQLGEGKLKEARKGFEQIKNDDALHFEGLAAVCFREGDYEKSLLLCDRALKLNRDNLYSHVIRGKVFLHQGKISEAALEYERATQLTQGADWQRAEAYNRLGRIYAAEQRVEEAVSFYTQAAVYNPGSPEIYTNHGILTEKEGDLTGALSLYKKALEVKPDDPIAKLLFKEASDKKGLVEDDERRQKVDRLVAELIETYREKKEQGSGREEDQWTSRPLTLSFLDFQKKGIPSPRDGEDECLLLNITSRLQEEGRIHIVERDLLDTLLEELKLGSSALADPELALRVGRIVAARLVVTGSITRYGNDLQVSLRLIDPETTAVKATIMEGAEKGTDIGELSGKVAQRIIEKLNSNYPLRCEIISLEGEDLILNIGSDQGVKSGSIMSIVAEMKPVQLKGRQVIPRGREIGKVEVTFVESSLAHAKIIEKHDEIQKGFKVEELTTQNEQRTEGREQGV